MLNTQITGEVMIFVNEYNDRRYYNCGISRKLADGTWENGTIPIQFKKDVVLTDQTKINIVKAWLTFYKKDKATIPQIFCSEFDEIKQEPASDFVGADDDELPF